MNEQIWRKAEANQLMRERRDRLKAGIINPRSVPNILIKTDEGWKFPEISTR